MIKILIVEDEISISHLIKLSLKRAGYACECAYDGEEAAEKLESGRYDLVLLDVMLPKLDGFELMEYIRPMEIPGHFPDGEKFRQRPGKRSSDGSGGLYCQTF